VPVKVRTRLFADGEDDISSACINGQLLLLNTCEHEHEKKHVNPLLFHPTPPTPANRRLIPLCYSKASQIERGHNSDPVHNKVISYRDRIVRRNKYCL
jgi:hypothetical protein